LVLLNQLGMCGISPAVTNKLYVFTWTLTELVSLQIRKFDSIIGEEHLQSSIAIG